MQKITGFIYTPVSGNLLVSLTIDSLVILPPKLLVLEEITILLDTSVSGISAQEMSDENNMMYKNNNLILNSYMQNFKQCFSMHWSSNVNGIFYIHSFTCMLIITSIQRLSI